jgi:hypothetical protein
MLSAMLLCGVRTFLLVMFLKKQDETIRQSASAKIIHFKGNFAKKIVKLHFIDALRIFIDFISNLWMFKGLLVKISIVLHYEFNS